MSDIHKLQNGFLEIAVKEKGAELCSLVSLQNNIEYIWQADAAFWPRHAPVLFPVVGKLKDDTYKFNGKNYQLGQHGFARDKDFTKVEIRQENSLAFVLKDDEKSFEKFPFKFELWIIYTLQDNILQITYRVINTSNTEMYFSVGGHPAFNCPLNETEEVLDDYFLEFNQKENAERWLLEGGLLNGKTQKVLENESVLPLSEALFAEDALVFKNLKSTSVKLKSKNSSNGLDFIFIGFPYLGIWKKPGASFICIEPWFGIADSIDTEQELTSKEGVLMLEAGEKFVCTYSLTAF